MNLSDTLTADAVAYRSDLGSKKRAIEETSRLLAGAARTVTDNEVFASLIKREKRGSTALGGGVAIPHGRLAGLDRAVSSFMRLEQGIDYDAEDGSPVDLVFGLLVPEEANNEHLQLLASIAEMLQDDELIATIRSSTDAAEIHNLLTTYNP